MLVTRDSNLFNSEKGTSKAQSLPIALSLQTISDKENLQSLANATIAKLCRVSEIYDLDVEKPKGTRGKQEFINNITTKIQQKEKALGIHERLNIQGMGRLYSGLDKIKDMCPDLNLTLPQIVVIGDESTGKSSLIERIAMFSFFPRGNESQQRSLCTRMPIQLRLKRLSTPELQVFTQEHKLEYKPNHCWVRLKYEPVNGTPQESPFFDRDEVEQQVKYYMEQAVQGNNNAGVCEDVLVVEVISDQVPNLTLVDLPGIVHVARPQEPPNLPKLTEEISKKYINQPHTLIIAVSRATDSQRNSKALALIKEQNKEHLALGVLTMCDLVSDNTRLKKDFLLRLQNNAPDSISLKHGYIGVRNRDTRSEEDGEEVRSLVEAAAEETEWFQQKFPTAAPNSCTTPVLITRLVELIVQYSKQTWAPETKVKIENQKEKLNRQLATFGTPDPATLGPADQKKLLTELCTLLLQKAKWFSNVGAIKQCFDIPYCANVISHSTNVDGMKQWSDWKIEAIGQASRGFRQVLSAILDRIAPTFQENNEMPLLASRFTAFQTHAQVVFQQLGGQFIPNCERRLQKEVKYLFAQGDWELDRRSITDRLYNLAVTIAYEELILPLSEAQSVTSFQKQLLAMASLKELLTDCYKEQRETIKSQINNLDLTIAEIDKLFV